MAALLSMWQMVSLYYALPKENENDCQKFDMSVHLLSGNMSLFVAILFAFSASICSTVNHPSW